MKHILRYLGKNVACIEPRDRALRALILALALFLPASLQAADHALTFTNNTHYVSTTGRVSSLSFTIEAWVRPTTFIGENQVASQYDGSSGRMIVALRSNKASFFIGGTWLDGSAGIPLNAWTHIAATRSGSTANIYTNGVLDLTSSTFPTNALPPVGIMIGGISSFNNGFRGQIAEVRAWNLVRTQAQIQAGKGSRLVGNEAGLAGYWRLDEGLGPLAFDHAANANGTITGCHLGQRPRPARLFNRLHRFLEIILWRQLVRYGQMGQRDCRQRRRRLCLFHQQPALRHLDR